MAKAIESLPSGLQIGHALLGRHGDGRGSPVQQVHDGDTVIVEANGNLSVRFLGIDTPEVSFTLPGSQQFRSIASAEWTQFLDDPFAGASGGFINALGNALHQHLQNVTGAGCAANHHHHADAAHRRLEQLVQQDMDTLGQDRNTFQFFMAFANEVMDGFGRLLCFLNRDQPHPIIPEARPRSYNERMLELGITSPYFIWPNINPFRRAGSLVDAVPQPGNIQAVANAANGLGPARQWVHAARQQQHGIFEAGNPLRLEPFELRFLARRSPPHRWVIDMGDAATTTLVRPTNYHTIQNIEDRLFVPAEYVALFVEAGWQRQA